MADIAAIGPQHQSVYFGNSTARNHSLFPMAVKQLEFIG